MGVGVTNKRKSTVGASLCPAGGAVLAAPAPGGLARLPAALNMAVILIRLRAAPLNTAASVSTLGITCALELKGKAAFFWVVVFCGTSCNKIS